MMVIGVADDVTKCRSVKYLAKADGTASIRHYNWLPPSAADGSVIFGVVSLYVGPESRPD